MYFIPSCDFPTPSASAQTALYTALECLRVAIDRLDVAIERYDLDALLAAARQRQSRMPPEYARQVGQEDVMSSDDLVEACCTCRFFANVIEEIATGIPVVSDRVLQKLRAVPNESAANPAHVEAAVLALRLAHRHLRAAWDISAASGEDSAPDHEFIVAAASALNNTACFLEGGMVGVHQCDDERLDAILAGEEPSCLAAA